MCSTVISVPSQLLQTTVNSRLDFSGNDPPFSVLHVPANLTLQVAEAPRNRFRWDEARCEADVAQRPVREVLPCDLGREKQHLGEALRAVDWSIARSDQRSGDDAVDEVEAACDFLMRSRLKRTDKDRELDAASAEPPERVLLKSTAEDDLVEGREKAGQATASSRCVPTADSAAREWIRRA